MCLSVRTQPTSLSEGQESKLLMVAVFLPNGLLRQTYVCGRKKTLHELKVNEGKNGAP